MIYQPPSDFSEAFSSVANQAGRPPGPWWLPQRVEPPIGQRRGQGNPDQPQRRPWIGLQHGGCAQLQIRDVASSKLGLLWPNGRTWSCVENPCLSNWSTQFINPLFAITSAGSALIVLRSSVCWIRQKLDKGSEVEPTGLPSSNREASLPWHERLKDRLQESGKIGEEEKNRKGDNLVQLGRLLVVKTMEVTPAAIGL